MPLEVYYPSDIISALLAAEQATTAMARAAGESSSFEQGYITGYRAALTTFALAFGIKGVTVHGNDESTKRNSLGGSEAIPFERVYQVPEGQPNLQESQGSLD